jgi:hypothetical protein
VRIHVEAEEGELARRLPDAVKALERIAGRKLCKSDPEDEPPRPLLPALEGILSRGREHRDRIEAVLLAKMLAVLDEV